MLIQRRSVVFPTPFGAEDGEDLVPGNPELYVVEHHPAIIPERESFNIQDHGVRLPISR